MRSFLYDKSGSVAVVFAIALLPVLVAAGGAADYSRAAALRGELQALADAAALHAARTARTQADADRIAAEMSNGTDVALALALAGEDAAATARRSADTAFLRLVGIDAIPLAARAVARRPSSGSRAPVCVLALDAEAEDAVSFGGNSDFAAAGCWVQANSRHDRAITLQGSARAAADGFCAAGGSSGALTPTPRRCRARPDPFASLPRPNSAGCTATGPTSVNPNSSRTFDPGIYCSPLDIRGTAVFRPGVYVLKAGLRISSQATVSGQGVTFHLTGTDATFTINGGGAVSLSAPEDGPYSGILVHQDAAAGAGSTSRLNGNSETVLRGAIYMPTQTVLVNGTGTFGQTSVFMPIVANRVSFTGNSTVRSDAGAMRTPVPMPAMEADVRLVE